MALTSTPGSMKLERVAIGIHTAVLLSWFLFLFIENIFEIAINCTTIIE